MFNLPQFCDFDLAGKEVLLRTDLNVPLQGDEVTDDYRIVQSLPTIQALKKQGAKITVCGHLGRPDNKLNTELRYTEYRDDTPPEFSLEPARQRLVELLGEDIPVIENLRFWPGETAGIDTTEGKALLEKLVAKKDFYINDAFSASHRQHTSIVGPPTKLSSAAGLLLTKEVAVLEKLLENVKRPFVVIMGGAKVSDKLGLIHSLAKLADVLAIGGAMAFSFLVAKGATIESSLVEHEQLPALASLLNTEHGKKIHLPTDFTAEEKAGEVVQIGTNVPDGFLAKDIGPGTAAAYADLIDGAGTVFWNGPMGVFEDERFQAGTKTLAEAMAHLNTQSNAYTVVGGGDSASAIRALKLEDQIDHLSTGGGATLEFLEKGTLPGIEALRN